MDPTHLQPMDMPLTGSPGGLPKDLHLKTAENTIKIAESANRALNSKELGVVNTQERHFKNLTPEKAKELLEKYPLLSKHFGIGKQKLP